MDEIKLLIGDFLNRTQKQNKILFDKVVIDISVMFEFIYSCYFSFKPTIVNAIDKRINLKELIICTRRLT